MPFSNTPTPTQFEVNIQKNTFRFGALSMKQVESFVKEEKDAADRKDFPALLVSHRQLLVEALNRSATGDKVSLADIEDLDSPLFNALFSAVMQAHGMKPESTVGEVKPQ